MSISEIVGTGLMNWDHLRQDLMNIWQVTKFYLSKFGEQRDVIICNFAVDLT